MSLSWHVNIGPSRGPLCFILTNLPVLRYVDVSVGVSLLISQSCLIIGARNSKIHHILVFLILSVLVIGAYWAWWAGLYYHKSETEASKEVTQTY